MDPTLGRRENPHAQLPEVFNETVSWLNQHLKTGATGVAR